MADRVVVVGGGSMGAGIAAVAAGAGYGVTLVEPDALARERAAKRVPAAQIVADIPEDRDAMLAIEAVPERIDLKQSVFALLEGRLPNAVLASNTSSLSVSEIARAVRDPRRVVGLHFFNPPEKMALVEIVCAGQSGEGEIESARTFVERLGKTGIVTADTPGFVVNRIARPFYLQAMRALEARVADIEEIDALVRGVGFRMGPFELMDFIGLDVNLATSESIYERTQEERLAPVALQQTLVASGRLGRKSGSGFYSYDAAPARIELQRTPQARRVEDELVAVLGSKGLADELAAALEAHFAAVIRLYDDDDVERMDEAPTVLVDVGDGQSDRSSAIARFDGVLPAECAILIDAYATDTKACAKRMRSPERLIGYGIIGTLEAQTGVEIADDDTPSDDTLALAQEMFEAIGHGVVLVENVPGLVLGRVLGSIINEAVAAVEEGVATAHDVDLAMRLGTNYPRGPIEWGREIGGRRIMRILQRVAGHDGVAFAPHRALWVLDVDEEPEATEPETTATE